MSITGVDKDYDHLTLTAIAEFDAPSDQVWELWSDPRKLERWWGPPGYPATFVKHDLTPRGEVTYVMTGPEGEKLWGAWRVTAVNPPTSLVVTDACADAAGTPVEDTPVHYVSVQLGERDGGTRMEMRSRFDSREDMERVIEMGTAEGRAQAIGQMDALAGVASPGLLPCGDFSFRVETIHSRARGKRS
jgi:uncharacterized protein YndB with AHSA1/START domain